MTLIYKYTVYISESKNIKFLIFLLNIIKFYDIIPKPFLRNFKFFIKISVKLMHSPSFLEALNYPCFEELNIIQQQLKLKSGIVSTQDVLKFKHDLSKVTSCQAQLLHIGECAETFENSTASYFSKFNSAIATISEVFNNKSLIYLGRVAGQFFKPRSKPFLEDGITLAYHGDGFHSYSDRTLDPNRLLTVYQIAIKAHEILCPNIRISHECLNLPYENGLLRDSTATSAHLLWIGSRSK